MIVAKTKRVRVTGERITSTRDPVTASLSSILLLHDDGSSSSVRKTLCGRWLPLEVAIVDMMFMASLIRPRTRYHRGDSEMKGRTKRRNTREGIEEAMYSSRHLGKMFAMPERTAMPVEKK